MKKLALTLITGTLLSTSLVCHSVEARAVSHAKYDNKEVVKAIKKVHTNLMGLN